MLSQGDSFSSGTADQAPAGLPWLWPNMRLLPQQSGATVRG